MFCYYEGMQKPNFILINGFAGAGKSTISKKYIDHHALSLVVEGDQLIVNLGDWLENEDTARDFVFDMIKSLVILHLSKGHDVVLPYLVEDNLHIEEFEKIAINSNASFYNFFLYNEKKAAIQRLMERGTWGEAGTDPISDKDKPEIERLYTTMEQQVKYQDRVIIINQDGLSAEESYSQILSHISR